MTPTERFELLLTAIGIVAGVIAWFIKRAVAKLDAMQGLRDQIQSERWDAMAERWTRMDGHYRRQAETVTALATTVTSNQRELTDRLVTTQETLTERWAEVAVTVARNDAQLQLLIRGEKPT